MIHQPQLIVVGTHNAKKLSELQRLLADFPIQIVSLADFPDAPEVEEDGDTFEANAVKKATELALVLGEWVVADDSGLTVDALDGRPGVMSARYAGEHGNDPANVAKLLAEMADVPDDKRGAQFRCVIALASPEKVELIADGACRGVVAREARGHNGFGYDPVFFYPAFGKTFAEVEADAKNGVSHRGRALAAFKAKAAALFAFVARS